MSPRIIKDYAKVELREYIESLISAQKEATKVAKDEMNRRLEGMNEFREQLRTQASTFLTRERFDVEHELLKEKIEELLLWKAEQQGKNDRANLISIIAVIVSVFVGIASTILHFTK